MYPDADFKLLLGREEKENIFIVKSIYHENRNILASLKLTLIHLLTISQSILHASEQGSTFELRKSSIEVELIYYEKKAYKFIQNNADGTIYSISVLHAFKTIFLDEQKRVRANFLKLHNLLNVTKYVNVLFLSQFLH